MAGRGSWWLRPRVQGGSLFTVCLSGPFKLYTGDKCHQLKPVLCYSCVFSKLVTHMQREMCSPCMPLSCLPFCPPGPRESLELGQPLQDVPICDELARPLKL